MAVARETGLSVGEAVVRQRTQEVMQRFADGLPVAQRYCSDPFPVYAEVIWPMDGAHVLSRQKEETYTIESLNANLRTYLKRLARRSRCFSRCIQALRRAVRLFVFHYNRRQLHILAHPQYRDRLPLLF